MFRKMLPTIGLFTPHVTLIAYCIRDEMKETRERERLMRENPGKYVMEVEWHPSAKGIYATRHLRLADQKTNDPKQGHR